MTALDIFIELVQQFNFLELILNENLSLKNYCNKISNDSKSVGVLNRLKHFLPENTRIMIYNSKIQTLIIAFYHGDMNKLDFNL